MTSDTLSQIVRALDRHFARHRIVVWSDPAGQFAQDFADLAVTGVVTVELASNELAVKYLVLREEPKQKFLIYRPGPVPADRDNWLLDIELSHVLFSAERDALLAQEVGLPDAAGVVVAEHGRFFAAAKRRADLASKVAVADTADEVRWKMLAVLCKVDLPRPEAMLAALLAEAATDRDDTIKLIVDCQLDDLLWSSVRDLFGYGPTQPTIEDFSLWLFRRALSGFVVEGIGSTAESGSRATQVFLSSWQDSVRGRDSFATMSRRAGEALDVRTVLVDRDFATLRDMDVFRAVDERIITELAEAAAQRTMPVREISELCRSRRTLFWGDNFDNLYAAIDAGARLLEAAVAFDPVITSLDDGLRKYAKTWFTIDQLYRHFTFNAREADSTVLDALRKQVEAFYTNRFVRKLGDSWQAQVNEAGPWRAPEHREQARFFEGYVAPVVKGGRNKIVVVISDGLRYEIAEELGSRIRREDRFSAHLDVLFGSLPSYTQLGMASLLPNRKLKHTEGTRALVQVDGRPSDGTTNRARILADVDGAAIQAEDLFALDKQDARELVKSVQVLYVYHNRIDKTGDNRDSERRVFQAAEDTLNELLALLKKLAGANVNNVIITADHGFLYQDSELQDADYVHAEVHGDKILYQDRRFVLGHGLQPADAFSHYQAKDIGLAGDIEVLIPKSIGRLGLHGGGSRYVHGGACLQEIAVPVLRVSKKRSTDIRPVGLSLHTRAGTITTFEVAVDVHQGEPVSDKIQARTVRIGMYSRDVLISNLQSVVLDSESLEARDRTQKVTLLLTREADAHDGREVEIRVEEQTPNTNHYTTVTKATATLRRTFGNDFDF